MGEREERADRIITRAVGSSDALVMLQDTAGTRTRERLASELESLDSRLRRSLKKELKQLGSDSDTPSGASVLVMLALASSLANRAAENLRRHLRRGTAYATKAATKQTGDLLASLEEVFEGFSPSKQLRRLGPLMEATGYSQSLLAIHETSIERYGTALVGRFEDVIRRGLIEGRTQGQIVDELTRVGGGVFTHKRWWAERIVRTETARAYNAAKEVAYSQYATIGIVIKKKIIAIFDNRTAYDSVYVHGQVRGPGEYFIDGAGRSYLFPPGRPNDRETIIPWKSAWVDTPLTRAVSASEMPAPPKNGLRKTPENPGPIKGLLRSS
jgi:hypothetical protein